MTYIQTLVLLFALFLSVKHGAVWMYQNSWLSFYSAVQPCSVVPPPYRTSSQHYIVLYDTSYLKRRTSHLSQCANFSTIIFKLFKFFKNGFSSLAHHFFLLWLHKQQEEEVGNELFFLYFCHTTTIKPQYLCNYINKLCNLNFPILSDSGTVGIHQFFLIMHLSRKFVFEVNSPLPQKGKEAHTFIFIYFIRYTCWTAI